MKYLASPQAAEIWAKLGGFGTRQQERARERLSGPDHEGDGDAARGGDVGRLRHVRRAARLVRRDDRPGRVGDLPEVPPEPIEHREHPAAARELGSEGVQEREVGLERCFDHGGAAPEGGSAGGRWGGQVPLPDGGALPPAGLHPARRLARLSDDLHDRPQLLRAGGIPRHVGRDRQLQDAVHDLDARHGDQEQRDLGCRRARLRDARSGSSSPSSPSASAGRSRSRRSSSCRWRSPPSPPASPGGSCTSRTRTRARSTRSGARSRMPSPRRESCPTPSRRRRLSRAQGGGLVLKTPLHPGGVALLGLTGIAPEDMPQGAQQAVKPSREVRRDRGRRLARLQARRREARRRRAG